ncbi:uncharacterized protein LOC131953760 isoform X2 [Physella acuta]|uniref:uncharacterized protein LOC131953760 isoform X2 n=1 Tax=Physella acuta TaxID=109671 RepID=UPI0027DAC373|nr:uncharacterized protein LOC131953760 isoform X2 [Physella acuta]
MRRLKRDVRWITQTNNFLVAVMAAMTSMALAMHTFHDDFNEENVPVPVLLPGVETVNVSEGGVAILPCSVKHLGTKQVSWARIYDAENRTILTIGATLWTEDINLSIDHSKNSNHVTQWNLVIKHVAPRNAGTYECQVTSKFIIKRYVTLHVDSSNSPRHPPQGHTNNVPNVPVSVCGAAGMHGCWDDVTDGEISQNNKAISITGKRFVDLGEKIHLVCNASGGPRVPDEIDWFKGGDKIDSTKYRHVTIDKYQSMTDRSFVSELIIDHSSHSDTGDYICRSSSNDIVNLKVTVLNAESTKKNRDVQVKGEFVGNGGKSIHTKTLVNRAVLAAILTLCSLYLDLVS